MGEPVTEGTATAERGLTPFFWFGVAVVVGAAYALFMGLAYYNTPTFTVAALPTIAGVAVAVVIFLVIGILAPPNE
jgi:membrane-bound acyltransferase YfiQ involved in biofilm formation